MWLCCPVLRCPVLCQEVLHTKHMQHRQEHASVSRGPSAPQEHTQDRMSSVSVELSGVLHDDEAAVWYMALSRSKEERGLRVRLARCANGSVLLSYHIQFHPATLCDAEHLLAVSYLSDPTTLNADGIRVCRRSSAADGR